jgi:hypothetical protein
MGLRFRSYLFKLKNPLHNGFVAINNFANLKTPN